MPARDSTGAGDTHTGALVAARADGRSWAPAVGAANAAVAAFLERSEEALGSSGDSHR
ncbi:MAG: PfkB family carbohydrate kinase [Actinomycetota bacterium]|nr:PfkB family carbohydrate kinase [Actinomycetota bacterium]